MSEFGDVLGGHDQVGLDEYLRAVDLEEVDREGGVMGAYTLFIG